MIFLIRHGQTNFNREHKIQGALVDEPLNENGINEAKILREIFKNHHFDAVIYSPLTRSEQTAKIIAEESKVEEFKSDERFIERNYGIMEGKRTPAKNFTYYFSEDIEGAESPKDLYKRISEALADVAQSYDGDVLIVSHGGITGSYVSNQLGRKDIKIDNGSCILVDKDGQMLDYNVSKDRIKEILDNIGRK